jgi:hypothetical protein
MSHGSSFLSGSPPPVGKSSVARPRPRGIGADADSGVGGTTDGDVLLRLASLLVELGE